MNPTLRSAGLTGLKCLNEAGYEAWWVGGCVRDALLERPVQDIDVTTSALPEQTIACFRNAGYLVIPTGLKHGTVTVMIHDFPIEVTTYRSDAGCHDHRASRIRSLFTIFTGRLRAAGFYDQRAVLASGSRTAGLFRGSKT